MRYSFQGIAQDVNGTVVPGAVITVYVEDSTTTVAEIYAAKTGGSPISGSYVTADDNGRWIFYVDDQTYGFLSMFNLKMEAAGMDTTWFYDVR